MHTLVILIFLSLARDNALDADATVDEVSTSSKGDHGGKPRKVEGKDVPSPGSSSFTPVTSGGRNEQLMTVRERSAGTFVAFLVILNQIKSNQQLPIRIFMIYK